MNETCAEKCYWVYDADDDAFDTGCDERFAFTAGGPEENVFYFCPYCGKKLAELVPVANGTMDSGHNEAQPARESVDEALMVVETYGPWGADLNDAYRRQIVLADEVIRLRSLYEMAVRGRAEMRTALRGAGHD